MTTSAEAMEFGSVEHRVKDFRLRGEHLVSVAFGAVQGIVEEDYYDSHRKVELIGNVVAAYKQVHAERVAADTGLGFDSSQLADADATPIPASRRYPPHLEDGRTGQVVEETCGTPTDGGPCARQAGHLAMRTAAAPKVPATDPGDVPTAGVADELVHGLRKGGESWCGGHHVRATFKSGITCPECLAAIASAD